MDQNKKATINFPFSAGDLIVVKNFDEKSDVPYIVGRLKEIVLLPTGVECCGGYHEYEPVLRIITKTYPESTKGNYSVVNFPLTPYVFNLDYHDMQELYCIDIKKFNGEDMKFEDILREQDS